MFTHLGDSFDYVFTLNPCKVLNVGIVICQRKSFLSIWILLEKKIGQKHYPPPFSHGNWRWNGMSPMAIQKFLFKMLMELN